MSNEESKSLLTSPTANDKSLLAGGNAGALPDAPANEDDLASPVKQGPALLPPDTILADFASALEPAPPRKRLPQEGYFERPLDYGSTFPVDESRAPSHELEEEVDEAQVYESVISPIDYEPGAAMRELISMADEEQERGQAVIDWGGAAHDPESGEDVDGALPLEMAAPESEPMGLEGMEDYADPFAGPDPASQSLLDVEPDYAPHFNAPPPPRPTRQEVPEMDYYSGALPDLNGILNKDEQNTWRARHFLMQQGQLAPLNESEARRISEEQGIPLEIARVFNDDMIRAINERKLLGISGLRDLAAQSPQDAQAVARYGQVAVAAHDSLKNFGRPAFSFLERGGPAFLDPPKAFYNGVIDLFDSFNGTLRMFTDATLGADSAASKWLAQGHNIFKSLQFEVESEGALGFANDFMRNGPQLAMTMGLALASGGASMAAQAGGTAARAAAAGAANQALASGGFRAGLQELGKSFTRNALPTAFMGSHIAGSSYNQLVDEGVPQGAAFWPSIANAAGQMPLEMIQLKLLRGFLLGKGARNIFRQLGYGASVEFVTETAQKMPEWVAHGWARSARHFDSFPERLRWFTDYITDRENIWQATREALYEGAIGAAWGGALGGGIQLAHNIRHPIDHKGIARELLSQKSQIIDAAPLRQAANAINEAYREKGADPEALSMTLRAIEKDIPAQARQMWIQPENLEILYARHAPADVNAALGLTAAEADEVLQSRAPAPVRTMDILTRNSEVARDAFNYLSMSESGLTLLTLEDPNLAPDLLQTLYQLDEDESAELFSDEDKRREALYIANRQLRLKAEIDAEVIRLEGELRGARVGEQSNTISTDMLRSHLGAMNASYGLDIKSLAKKLKARFMEEIGPNESQLASDEMPRDLEALAEYVYEQAGGLDWEATTMAYRKQWLQNYINQVPQIPLYRENHRASDTDAGEASAENVSHETSAQNEAAPAAQNPENVSQETLTQDEGAPAAQNTENVSQERSNQEASTPENVSRSEASPRDETLPQDEASSPAASPSAASPQPASSPSPNPAAPNAPSSPNPSPAPGPNPNPTPQPSLVRRAAIRFLKDSIELIFSKKQRVDSLPHEFAHLFLHNICSIGLDTGKIALANMAERINAHFEDAATGEIIKRHMARITGALDPLQAVHEFRHDMLEMARNAKEEEADLRRRQTELEKLRADPLKPMPELDQAAYGANLAYRRKIDYSRAARAAKDAAKHIEGIGDARNDIDIISQACGLSQDELNQALAWYENQYMKGGPSTDAGKAHYTRLQEFFAEAAISWYRQGRAPSKKLAGAFHHLSQMLNNYYRALSGQQRLQLSPDLVGVMERIHATRREINEYSALGVAAMPDEEYLDQLYGLGALSKEKYDKLKYWLKAIQAELADDITRQQMDLFKKHRKERLPELKKELAASALWTIVREGDINASEFEANLGKLRADELRRRFPDLVKEGGRPMRLALASFPEYASDADINLFFHELHETLIRANMTLNKMARKMLNDELDEMARDEIEGRHAVAMDKYLKFQEALEEAALESQDILESGGASFKWRYRGTNHEQIDEQARTQLSMLPLSAVTAARFRSALESAIGDRARHMAMRDFPRAHRALHQVRLYSSMMYQASKIRADAEKIRRELLKLRSGGPEKIAVEHLHALSKIREFVGMKPLRGAVDRYYLGRPLRELVENIVANDCASGEMQSAPKFADWLLDGIHPATNLRPTSGSITWNTLNMYQLKQVKCLVQYLEYSGRAEYKNGRRKYYEEVERLAAELADELEKIDPENKKSAAARKSAPGTRRRWASDLFDKTMANVEQLLFQSRMCDAMNNAMGMGKMGPMETLFEEIARQGEKRRVMQKELAQEMAPALLHLHDLVKRLEKEYGKYVTHTKNGDQILCPKSICDAYRVSGWTPDMLIAFMLHCGSKSNMNRVAGGYPDLDYDSVAELFGEEMAADIFNRQQSSINPRRGIFSAQDWQAIQCVWDALGKHWEETKRVHRDLYGFTPEEIDRRGFNIRDEDGKFHNFRGGYFPIHYDRNISDVVSQWTERDELDDRQDALLGRPSARRNHTKNRTEKTPGYPVHFDTSYIEQHIWDMTTFITLQAPTRKFYDIIRQPRFRAQYERLYGAKSWEAMVLNLKGVLRREPGDRFSGIAQFAQAHRKYLIAWGLGWNPRVAMLQLTAIFSGMSDLGTVETLKSICALTGKTFANIGEAMLHASINDLSKSPLACMRDIWKASSYMLSRKDGIDQDMRRRIDQISAKKKMSVTIGGKNYTWDDVVDLGMTPILAMDCVAAGAIWTTAYRIKMRELNNNNWKAPGGAGIDESNQFHAVAVEFADKMVRQSNPDYDSISQTFFSRSKGLTSIFNTFTSAVNLYAERTQYQYKLMKFGKTTRRQFIKSQLLDYGMGSLYMFLLLAAARGLDYEDEDDKKALLKLGLSSIGDNVAMTVPFFGDVARSVGLNLLGQGDFTTGRGGARTGVDTAMDLSRRATSRVSAYSNAKEIAPPKNPTAKNLQKYYERVEKAEKERLENLIFILGDLISFVARVPVSRVARNWREGEKQREAGKGTVFSFISPRPKNSWKEKKEEAAPDFDPAKYRKGGNPMSGYRPVKAPKAKRPKSSLVYRPI